MTVLSIVLQAGAKVDAQDKALRTPLLEAIANCHVDVVRYLVQSGACVYHAVSGQPLIPLGAKLLAGSKSVFPAVLLFLYFTANCPIPCLFSHLKCTSEASVSPSE